MSKSIKRRRFLKGCLGTASMVSLSPGILAQDGMKPKPYNRSLLVQENGTPVSSAFLAETGSLIFHYPYVTTPCFLLDMGNPVKPTVTRGQDTFPAYEWPGGVGAKRSVIAFSAICAHKLSYPTRTASFINFRPEKISFQSSEKGNQTQENLIYCCSERSAYDPALGASVVGGPAYSPLTTIVLEHDPQEDHFHAVATLGKEQYDSFFEKFSFRIELETREKNIRDLSNARTTVYPADIYSPNTVKC